jgi:hypothetical protein
MSALHSLGASHIGRIAVPLSQFDNKKPVRQWYKLKNKQLETDGTDRGEVELLIHWKYTTSSADELRKRQEKADKNIFNKLGKAAGGAATFVGLVEHSDSEGSEDVRQSLSFSLSSFIFSFLLLLLFFSLFDALLIPLWFFDSLLLLVDCFSIQ